MPTVSVVIPTYNAARYIVATVESVLAQSYQDYELIVVDDGSTDNTRQLLHPYLERINYIYQENKKYSGARNRGIKAAAGKYIAFLDSDDLWRPAKLARQVAVMEQHPEVTLSHCQAAYIDPAGVPTQFRGSWVREDDAAEVIIADQTEKLFYGAIVNTSSVMVRHSTLQAVGPFDKTHIHGEDWELWVRLASRGPFAYLPEPLVQYRVYGWSKVLRAESSAEWVSDQFRTIKRATELWTGDPARLKQLRAGGAAQIYIRAALANYQMGQGRLGQTYLGNALAANSDLARPEKIVQLAIDRAKLIETETGSYPQAEAFVETFFHNLPGPIRYLNRAKNEALAWLYAGGAFESRRRQEPAETRRLLWQAIRRAQAILTNRGVLSLALEAGLGETVASKLRGLVG